MFIQKLSAGLEAGNPPDVMRLYESNVQFFGSQGHLVDIDRHRSRRCARSPRAIFEATLERRPRQRPVPRRPLAVNPWPVHARLDLLEKAKVDYPKTWDEFIETSKKIQEPPRLFAFGICLGLTFDTTDNVMNLLWCYGGKMVERRQQDGRDELAREHRRAQGARGHVQDPQDHPAGRDLAGTTPATTRPTSRSRRRSS